MQGVKDLIASERGIFAVILVVIVTVLVVLKIVKPDDWIAYTKWIAMTLIASKTITGAVETYAQKPASAVS